MFRLRHFSFDAAISLPSSYGFFSPPLFRYCYYASCRAAIADERQDDAGEGTCRQRLSLADAAIRHAVAYADTTYYDIAATPRHMISSSSIIILSSPLLIC